MISAASSSVRLLAGAVSACLAFPVLAEPLESTGHLALIPVERGYEITAVIEGREAATIEATLTVMKEDTTGRMETRQSQTVDTEADQSVEVARTHVSLSQEGRLEATLVLTGAAGPFFRTRHLITREALQ